MIQFEKLAENIYTAGLLEAISPEMWDEVRLRQETPGSPHKDTKCIFLRWARDFSLESAFGEVEAVDMPVIEKFKDVLPDFMAFFTELTGATEIGRVMLVELKPGGQILPHFDDGAYAAHYQRFHFSLVSEPGNLFYSETDEHSGEYVHMRPGEIWWFNHRKYHYLFNQSPKSRIHLIVDAVSEKFKEKL